MVCFAENLQGRLLADKQSNKRTAMSQVCREFQLKVAWQGIIFLQVVGYKDKLIYRNFGSTNALI
jgi:hypothetical protein